MSDAHTTTETEPTDGNPDPLVKVRGLKKHYFEQDSIVDRLLRNETVRIRAVDGISFDVYPGETLGVVGESGCGKSTTAETLMRLREPTAGSVLYEGDNIYEMDDTALEAFRRRAQVMFQDPFSSLDPRMTAGQIIREPLDVHGVGTKAERRDRAVDLLEQVGLSGDQVDRYPHEFSGGQRQRIGFARALALEPDFIVLDEPVSALDVSVQAQVLNLLSDMQEEFDLTYLFIAHDLSVVRHVCDRVAVMYLGEIVEIGPVDEIFEDPQHPYTEALLESVPRADTSEKEREVAALRGDVPSPRNPPSGCSFRTRCPQVIQPDGIDLPQDAYLNVTTLRNRIERDGLDRDFVWDVAGDPDREDVAAFKRTLWDEMLDRDQFAGEDEAVLDEALEALADDDEETAIDLLRDRYESVCEVVAPTLRGETHPTACHLREQPPEVEAAVRDWRQGVGGEGSADAPGVDGAQEADSSAD